MPIALTQFPRSGTIAVTQGYGGDTSHNNNPWSIDFSASSGTPILSVLSGTVVGNRTGSSVGDSAAGGYGNFVTILHMGGFYATYAHLTTDTVSIGQTVGAGTQIGTSGNTGATQGAHIHVPFGTRSNGGAIKTEGSGDIFRTNGGGEAVPPAFVAAFFSASEVGAYVDADNASSLVPRPATTANVEHICRRTRVRRINGQSNGSVGSLLSRCSVDRGSFGECRLRTTNNCSTI